MWSKVNDESKPTCSYLQEPWSLTQGSKLSSHWSPFTLGVRNSLHVSVVCCELLVWVQSRVWHKSQSIHLWIQLQPECKEEHRQNKKLIQEEFIHFYSNTVKVVGGAGVTAPSEYDATLTLEALERHSWNIKSPANVAPLSSDRFFLDNRDTVSHDPTLLHHCLLIGFLPKKSKPYCLH